jgi:glycerol-3-phosphate acyltransferase PlsX
MRIALDAMGSDEAPGPELAGARRAVEADPALELVLVGDGVVATHDRIRVVHAAERITAADHPAQVLRGKPGSSLHVAIDLVATGRADAVVSAGNSGAVLALAKIALPLAGPSSSLRPAIVTVLPAPAGPVVLCDAGANVEPRPAALARFAAIGAAYDRIVHGRACPRVGLLANGKEPSKGTAVTREAHALLAARDGNAFRYVGYVEGSDLFTGVVDVVVTDGFTGNVVLKTCEGIAEGMFGLVRRELDATPLARLGAAIVAPALRNVAHQIDYTEVGGALLAGVARPVVIAHGRSDATAIASAIRSAATFVARDLAGRIAAALAESA